LLNILKNLFNIKKIYIFAKNKFTLKLLFKFFIFAIVFHNVSYGQVPVTVVDTSKTKKIEVKHADFSDVNQYEITDAMVLTGNVRIIHDGATLTCNKAYFFKKENYLKAFGNVVLVQKDMTLTSNYGEYNGNTKMSYAQGNVIMNSSQSNMQTETLLFNRNTNVATYNSDTKIIKGENVLTSNKGRYIADQKMYEFRDRVVVTNPKYVITTNHLDYFEESGKAYLLGASVIKSKENYIYTEKGYYDTMKDEAYFDKNSHIKYNNRRIEADVLYYDKKREFSSGTRNVKITDTINKTIIQGNYGEVYQAKDSLMMTGRALAKSLIEKDTLYLHGKKLIVTGKPQNRIVRAYPNARFFNKDMSGKCDSIHSSEKNGLTKLIGKPILWHFDNQLTGDLMHLIADKKTEKLDSLKVFNNTFIISKDTISKTGYNQVKGLNLFGKFKDNTLKTVDIYKNCEVIYYLYDDSNELIGINKCVSSNINIIFDKNTVESIKFIKKPDGTIYPEDELPENARKLKGFLWRGDEQITRIEDIFPPEDKKPDKK
jgi:lipopolysaccharide export system protein LptA